MKLEIHLYGRLRRFTENPASGKPSVINIDVPGGITIRGALEKAGVPTEEVGTNIFLNGMYSSLDRAIEEGGRLGVFPDDMNLLYKWHFEKE
jgi:hypothetical protein